MFGVIVFVDVAAAVLVAPANWQNSAPDWRTSTLYSWAGESPLRMMSKSPDVGSEVTAGSTCGEIESTKSVSDVYAPVTGTVVARNESLDSAPELINSDPYGEGWMLEIRPADGADPEGLLTADAYQSGLDQS